MKLLSTSIKAPPSSPDPARMLDSLNDVIRAAKSAQDWGRQYDEVEIVTADGQRMIVLARTVRRARATNYAFFGVSDISADGALKILVNDGVLAAADTAGIDSDPPTIATLSKEYPVAGGEFDVVDGSKVYLKITIASTTATNDYTNEGADTTDGLPDEGTYPVEELITVKVWNNSKSWTATSAEIIVQTGVATGDSNFSYRLLAEISITDGSMTIKPRHDGAVSVPCVSASYGDDVTVDACTEDHEVCIDGSAHDVTFICKTNPD